MARGKKVAPVIAEPVEEQLSLFDYAELDLPTAKFVRDRTAAIRESAQRTVSNVLAIGEDLAAVKERLNHGQYGRWLNTEFRWSDRTARTFIRTYETFKSETVSDLEPFDLGALYLLAAPSTPQVVRDALLDEPEKRITKSDVRVARDVADKVSKSLSKDAGPKEVKAAIREAVKEARGSPRKAPPGKEADRQARETGMIVWGSDGRWHDGKPPPSEDERRQWDAMNPFLTMMNTMPEFKLSAAEVCDQLTRLVPWEVKHMRKEIPPLISLLTDVLNLLNKETNRAA